MLSASILLAALVGIAQAQTPQGFTPQVNTQLGVFFNSTAVRTPGQQLTKAATSSQPQIAASSDLLNSEDTYVFVMLDLDVPPAQGTTERRVLLHAMNTGFKATQQQIGGSATLLASTDRGPAPYLPPGPPATDTKAHRYVQLLFQQPASLQVQAADFQDTQARFNFDIESFASQNGLGQPLAGNFFTVDGRTGASASASASRGASGTGGGIAENTLLPPPFEGGAKPLEFQWSVFGLIGGAALAMI